MESATPKRRSLQAVAKEPEELLASVGAGCTRLAERLINLVATRVGRSAFSLFLMTAVWMLAVQAGVAKLSDVTQRIQAAQRP
jgi:hypothetical protein